MKVTAVRLLLLTGVMSTDGPLWEERLVRPIDIYPEYRARNDFEGGVQVDAGHFRLAQHFLRIETDEGPIGIAGPLPDMVAAFVARRLRPIILGQDPIAHEKLWDQMHRIMVHGRQGDAMLAARWTARCGTSKAGGSGSRCSVCWAARRVTASRRMRRCLALPCWTWAACASVQRNTAHSAIRRRNGSFATVR
jgi:hypothetical protein